MSTDDPNGAGPTEEPAVIEGTLVDGEPVPGQATSTTPAGIGDGYLPPIPDPNYTDAGVPTFDFVRDKIENRISTAIGSQELAEESPEGQQVDEMMRKRDEAAKKRLEEIRKSMGS